MGPYDPQAEIHNFWRTSPPLTFLPHFFPFADDRHTGLTDPEASGITGEDRALSNTLLLISKTVVYIGYKGSCSYLVP